MILTDEHKQRLRDFFKGRKETILVSNILSCGRVDLIILNDTPIRLYHNVLKKESFYTPVMS